MNWHVVGSDNNRLSDDPTALTEYLARTKANAQLTAAALEGYKGYLRAVVITTHASMALEQNLPPRGYLPSHRLLQQVLASTTAGTDHPW